MQYLLPKKRSYPQLLKFRKLSQGLFLWGLPTDTSNIYIMRCRPRLPQVTEEADVPRFLPAASWRELPIFLPRNAITSTHPDFSPLSLKMYWCSWPHSLRTAHLISSANSVQSLTSSLSPPLCVLIDPVFTLSILHLSLLSVSQSHTHCVQFQLVILIQKFLNSKPP